MRSLFMLLLVVNLSYLVWGVAFSEKSNAPEVPQQLEGVQTLMLLNEQMRFSSSDTHDDESAKKEEIAKLSTLGTELDKNMSPSIGPAKTCYSLGPILDIKDKNSLERKLQKSGFKIKHKAITDKEPKSYWVYFPAEKSLADARAVVSQLQAAKLKDYQIIRKGKFTHAISLGLYNGYSRAKIRVGRLKKLGFDPKIQTRYKQVTRHWLDFQETDAKRLNTSVWEKIQEDNPLQKLARPCADPALDSAPADAKKKTVSSKSS